MFLNNLYKYNTRVCKQNELNGVNKFNNFLAYEKITNGTKALETGVNKIFFQNMRHYFKQKIINGKVLEVKVSKIFFQNKRFYFKEKIINLVQLKKVNKNNNIIEKILLNNYLLILIRYIIYYGLNIMGKKKRGMLLLNIKRAGILTYINYITEKGKMIKDYIMSFNPFNSDKKIIEDVLINKENVTQIINETQLTENVTEVVNELMLTGNVTNLVNKSVLTEKIIEVVNEPNVTETLVEVTTSSSYTNYIIGGIVLVGIGMVSYYIYKQFINFDEKTISEKKIDKEETISEKKEIISEKKEIISEKKEIISEKKVNEEEIISFQKSDNKLVSKFYDVYSVEIAEVKKHMQYYAISPASFGNNYIFNGNLYTLLIEKLLLDKRFKDALFLRNFFQEVTVFKFDQAGYNLVLIDGALKNLQLALRSVDEDYVQYLNNKELYAVDKTNTETYFDKIIELF